MSDCACVRLRVLCTGASLLMGCQVVVIGVVAWVVRMGLGPLVGWAVGCAMAILIAGKENLPTNPIVLAQQVYWGCHAPLEIWQGMQAQEVYPGAPLEVLLG